MYKVKYTKLALMPDGSKGNISQGNDIAYMQCNISEIDAILSFNLKRNEKKYHPVIKSIEKIEGQIVI